MTQTASSDENPDVIRTAELLGSNKALKEHVISRLDVHDLLEQGLPAAALEHLINALTILKVSPKEGLEKAIGMSVRTLQRHRQLGRVRHAGRIKKRKLTFGAHKMTARVKAAPRLNREQSGRVWKFAEILARATEVFGSQSAAEQWLESPAMALEQRKPIDLLSTPAGVEAVEQHLTRLEYGVYT